MTDLNPLIDAIQNGAFANTDLAIVPGSEHLSYTIGKDGRPIIVDLSELADRPTAKRGAVVLTAPDDFARYVDTHAIDGTAVFVDARRGYAKAIIDGHGTNPGHGHHTAEMKLGHSASWQRITRLADQTITQEQFANWLDDIRDEIRSVDTDELIELIDNLHIHANSTQKEVRATGHGRSIAYAEDVTIKAGKAGVELPNKITVETTVFDGIQKAWRFEIRLSVVAGAGKPTAFRLAIPRRDDVLEAATGEAMAVVMDLVTAPVYAGTAQHAPAPRPTVI